MTLIELLKLFIMSTVSPAVLSIVAYYILKHQKQQQWERDRKAQKQQWARDDATNDKLTVIHGLVNSSLTASIQDTYDQTSLLLIALKSLNSMNPDAEVTPEIARAEEKLTELKITIDDRDKAAEEVEKAAKAAKAAEKVSNQERQEIGNQKYDERDT